MVSSVALGRLGNQCFELATGLSYAFQNNLEFSAPLNSHPHFINLINPNLNPNLDKVYLHEKAFTYEPLEFKEEWRDKNIIIQGYRQSHFYFDKHREEVLNALNFLYERKDNFCSIHIRRTDYLKLQDCHPPVTMFYIQEAQQKIMNEGVGKFFVVSDDIEFCKEAMPQFEDADYIFSEGKTDVEDLSLASSCSCQIGSNSAYSWWAYYLNQNENKTGIFPRHWFGKGLPHDISDLIMPEMILL